MARNVAIQENRVIKHFTTGVFDLANLGDNPTIEAPKTDAVYYFRPFQNHPGAHGCGWWRELLYSGESPGNRF